MTGYIDDNIIERVRELSDIVQTISDYMTLKKTGANYKGMCPFHSEKTPSFVVSPEKQIYHCFGCGEGGNIFSFIMKWESLSFPEAVRQLAERHGISVPVSKNSRAREEKAEENEKLYDINKAAAIYYNRLLTDLPQGRPARDYLKRRGISPETVKKFLLGYATDAWDDLLNEITSRGVPLEVIAKAGLIKARSDKSGHYDTFRGRLIFPIQNVKGKYIAFGGRTLNDGDPKNPKYLNTPESPIYEKGANLYGLNYSFEQIRKLKDTILVEGYMDLLAAHQAGVDNVVATLGTAITRRQARLLKRYTPQATLVFDADTAGGAAAERGGGIFIEEGMKIRATSLPQGSDPDSYIKQQGAEAFARELEKAPPLMEFIIARAAKAHDLSTIEGRVECVGSVLPYLDKIKNSVEQGEYVKMLAARASVPEEDITAELKRASSPGRGRPAGNVGISKRMATNAPQDRFMAAEKQLLPLLLHRQEAVNQYAERIDPSLFRLKGFSQIIKGLMEFHSEGGEFNLSRLLDLLDGQDAKDICSRIMMQGLDQDDWARTAEDCLRLLEERAAEPGASTLERLDKAEEELNVAEGEGKDIGPLLVKLQELRRQLKNEGNENRLLRSHH